MDILKGYWCNILRLTLESYSCVVHKTKSYCVTTSKAVTNTFKTACANQSPRPSRWKGPLHPWMRMKFRPLEMKFWPLGCRLILENGRIPCRPSQWADFHRSPYPSGPIKVFRSLQLAWFLGIQSPDPHWLFPRILHLWREHARPRIPGMICWISYWNPWYALYVATSRSLGLPVCNTMGALRVAVISQEPTCL